MAHTIAILRSVAARCALLRLIAPRPMRDAAMPAGRGPLRPSQYPLLRLLRSVAAVALRLVAPPCASLRFVVTGGGLLRLIAAHRVSLRLIASLGGSLRLVAVRCGSSRLIEVYCG